MSSLILSTVIARQNTHILLLLKVIFSFPPEICLISNLMKVSQYLHFPPLLFHVLLMDEGKLAIIHLDSKNFKLKKKLKLQVIIQSIYCYIINPVDLMVFFFLYRSYPSQKTSVLHLTKIRTYSISKCFEDKEINSNPATLARRIR